ncbi:unnamed protein product [Protopolystoma xenopodis]|uniref:Uncharacterized protein n=1 Tax=Protopolystoma xenopodis TaxID=117903 RepID=A0A3S5FGT7_9PLAT|nr:unnamed protein product [Protopolystoma xenopodis]
MQAYIFIVNCTSEVSWLTCHSTSPSNLTLPSLAATSTDTASPTYVSSSVALSHSSQPAILSRTSSTGPFIADLSVGLPSFSANVGKSLLSDNVIETDMPPSCVGSRVGQLSPSILLASTSACANLSSVISLASSSSTSSSSSSSSITLHASSNPGSASSVLAASPSPSAIANLPCSHFDLVATAGLAVGLPTTPSISASNPHFNVNATQSAITTCRLLSPQHLNQPLTHRMSQHHQNQQHSHLQFDLMVMHPQVQSSTPVSMQMQAPSIYDAASSSSSILHTVPSSISPSPTLIQSPSIPISTLLQHHNTSLHQPYHNRLNHPNHTHQHQQLTNPHQVDSGSSNEQIVRSQDSTACTSVPEASTFHDNSRHLNPQAHSHENQIISGLSEAQARLVAGQLGEDTQTGSSRVFHTDSSDDVVCTWPTLSVQVTPSVPVHRAISCQIALSSESPSLLDHEISRIIRELHF